MRFQVTTLGSAEVMNAFVTGLLVLFGALLIFGVAWGAPIFAIPFVLFGIGIFGAAQFRRRVGGSSRLARFRSQRFQAPAHSTTPTGRKQPSD
jgi:uncharacterized membrane protein YoaK (UPF0700 family)